MSTRRETLLNSRAPREAVKIVMADGETVDVEVRGMSTGARGRLMKTCLVSSTNEDGETTQETDVEKLQPALVISCTFDPETGERLFGDADRDAILDMPASAVDPIITAAARLSGIGDKAVKVAEGNSDGTTARSTSDSSLPVS